jgi:co-chaperonin GroES (HSP10)|tara:strand:- start:2984 stop:3241 length:258 start_codon:yes stop_codon:yes gene_type:complete
MRFTPVNNHLYVEVLEEDKEETGILLPQDYRSTENPFAAVRVLAPSVGWGEGSVLIVESQMLQDIQYSGETFTVVKENYVIGVLS